MGTIESSVDRSVAKLEVQLESWGAKLDELVAKLETAGRETKVDARKRLDDMKVKLAAARAQLAEAKTAGAGRWDKFKAGVESSCKELEIAFHQLTH